MFALNSTYFAENAGNSYLDPRVRGLHRFLSHKWYFDTVYNRFINQPVLGGSYRVIFGLADKGALEVAGPTGLYAVTSQLGRLVARAQTGRVYDYA